MHEYWNMPTSGTPLHLLATADLICWAVIKANYSSVLKFTPV